MKSMTQKLLPLFALITLSAHPISLQIGKTNFALFPLSQPPMPSAVGDRLVEFFPLYAKPQPSLFKRMPAIKTAAMVAVPYALYKITQYFTKPKGYEPLDNAHAIGQYKEHRRIVDHFGQMPAHSLLSMPPATMVVEKNRWDASKKFLEPYKIVEFGKQAFIVGAATELLLILCMDKIESNTTFINWVQKYSRLTQTAISLATSCITTAAIAGPPSAWLVYRTTKNAQISNKSAADKHIFWNFLSGAVAGGATYGILNL